MEVKLMKSFSEKISIQKPIKKVKVTRFLITVNVLGSAGPLRFVVSENDKVAGVVDTALKQYAREGRLPILSSHVNDFFLYSASAGIDALGPLDSIGSLRVRNFILCKKQKQPLMTEERPHGIAQNGKGALGPLDSIGSLRVRNFIPCKKQKQPLMTEERPDGIAQNGKEGWMAWLIKSFNFNIHSH